MNQLYGDDLKVMPKQRISSSQQKRLGQQKRKANEAMQNNKSVRRKVKGK